MIACLLLALLGLSACAGQPVFLPPKAQAPAAPDSALQGTWTPKEDASPGPLRLETCYPAYESDDFDVGLQGVKLTSIWHSQGAYMPQEHFYEGHWAAGKLQLQETPNVMGDYQRLPGAPDWLAWDDKAQQWLGQINGASIRLARLILSPPSDCGPPPP